MTLSLAQWEVGYSPRCVPGGKRKTEGMKESHKKRTGKAVRTAASASSLCWRKSLRESTQSTLEKEPSPTCQAIKCVAITHLMKHNMNVYRSLSFFQPHLPPSPSSSFSSLFYFLMYNVKYQEFLNVTSYKCKYVKMSTSLQSLPGVMQQHSPAFLAFLTLPFLKGLSVTKCYILRESAEEEALTVF